MLNKFICIGNMTRDPELRFSQSGIAVCKFSIAINDGWGDKKTVSFINCVAFGKTAEATANYTHKGSKVGIESRVQTSSYENKEGKKVYTTDFIIDKIEFLDSKKDKQEEDVFTPVEDFSEVPF